MFKLTYFSCAITLGALSFSGLQADSPGHSFETDFSQESSSFSPSSEPSQERETPSMLFGGLDSMSLETPQAETPPLVASTPKTPAKPFSPFTGKIKGKKVRMRTQADLDSAIVKELSKGDLLSVVGEAEEFWIVEPPSQLKAYVFRPYILDNVVEGNRVNVRLAPSTDAAAIAQLSSGDHVEGKICSTNSKWIEIAMPSTARFYVAKSYIENLGGLEVKAQYEYRITLAKQLLETAECFSESEMQKSYPEIDFDKISHNFHALIREYTDFPSLAEQAKEMLAQVQEKFIDKRIAYMESKAKQEEFQTIEPKKEEVLVHSITDKMKLWEPVEEALYLSWENINGVRSSQDYYADQKLAADRITGIIEPYATPVKCKPGDYIIKQNDLPVGYLYSTRINLQDLVGKQVTLLGAPRPNNNFAFPAYFVLDIEN